eukprot:753301-Hanusia_phi.AAC.2
MVGTCKSDARIVEACMEGKRIESGCRASWCKVCQSIFPVFEDLEKHYGATLFMVVDVDENEAAAVSQGVDAMPTFVAYRNGNKVDE